MATADVGDDVLGDDPTVQALELETARLLGKEASLFMPSGTMTNQVAVRAHTEPGDELLLADNAHIYFYEGGAPAALAGVSCRLLPNAHGIFTPEILDQYLRPADVHFPRARMVSVENTSNRGGGRCWPLETLEALGQWTRERQLRLHMDGARLWNASVAQGIPEVRLVEAFDTVSVCFSKGLGAPVGSALAGSAEFIQRARRFRKQYGGGMRQAGIIAAGALYALQEHRARLSEDHANAQALAEGLADLPGVDLDLSGVETNIFYMNLGGLSGKAYQLALHEQGVEVLATGPNAIRVVTHLDFQSAQVDEAISRMRNAYLGLKQD